MTKRGHDAMPPKQVRCAIYTRNSSEEGLDQDFNSLDAQREAAESFIASQRAEGWTCVATRYDDGGFTGGNMDRPAVQRLLADIEGGLVDCVVVYKVDRLSRSLIDFARMMETFEKRGVSFVSVTQQFNTTHSMGRLTLNILLSFAQFEREIISERTRDKIAAAKRTGMWGGGRPILGYDIERHPGGNRLVVNKSEAERVRRIFALYLECGSVSRTIARLDAMWMNTSTKACLIPRGVSVRLDMKSHAQSGRRHPVMKPSTPSSRSAPQTAGAIGSSSDRRRFARKSSSSISRRNRRSSTTSRRLTRRSSPRFRRVSTSLRWIPCSRSCWWIGSRSSRKPQGHAYLTDG